MFTNSHMVLKTVIVITANIYHNYYVSGTNLLHNPIGVSTFILPVEETEAKSSEVQFVRTNHLQMKNLSWNPNNLTLELDNLS